MKTTVEQLMEIAEAAGLGRVWRHPKEEQVRLYVGQEWLELTPDEAIVDGVEIPAVRIRGRLSRRDGGAKAQIRDAARAAGLEIR